MEKTTQDSCVNTVIASTDEKRLEVHNYNKFVVVHPSGMVVFKSIDEALKFYRNI
ncbi:MAG: hypothetical protein FWB80_00425 [Defluviitaleaceae bacterium]|nr:hypothetical protein [Defluviitaleaceae bacterium]